VVLAGLEQGVPVLLDPHLDSLDDVGVLRAQQVSEPAVKRSQLATGTTFGGRYVMRYTPSPTLYSGQKRQSTAV
jgi:hypothetical protein